MKASEMTNEMLATWLEGMPADDGVLFHEVCHEAAARLRKQPPMRFEMAFHEDEEIIASLRAKLKVAEDALEKIRAEANQHELDADDTGVVFSAADNALAAIREEGGAK